MSYDTPNYSHFPPQTHPLVRRQALNHKLHIERFTKICTISTMNLASYAVAFVLAVPTATTASNSHDFEFNSMHQKTYGVDVSFPHHHTHVSTNYDWLPHNDPAKSSPSHPNYAPPPMNMHQCPSKDWAIAKTFMTNLWRDVVTTKRRNMPHVTKPRRIVYR